MSSSINRKVIVTDEKVAQYSGQTPGYLRDVGVTKLLKDKIVNFNNSMTASEIQALIDQQPRYIPYGLTLTFQFADGTYNLVNELVFDGFFGGGIVYIQGNTSEVTDLHTDQAVYLNFSSYVGIRVLGCPLFNLIIRFLKVKAVGSGSGETGVPIRVEDNSVGNVWYCYCINDTNSHANIEYKYSLGYVYKTYISGGATTGIQSDNSSRVYSSNNDDTGIMPVYGLDARDSGSIGKNGTQPAGSTANEQTATGGVIR